MSLRLQLLEMSVSILFTDHKLLLHFSKEIDNKYVLSNTTDFCELV